MFWFKEFIAVLLTLLTTCSVAATDISGAGSSAAQPLYGKWSHAYAKLTGATIGYQPVGSSAGIKQIKERHVDFGASDVAMAGDELKREKLICFPTAISGVVPVINIAGVKSGELRLSGEALADIFSRKITRWNDPALAALNPRLHLPNMAIALIVRKDGSGTTFNFADYLSKVSPEWKQRYGRNFTIDWPADATQVKGSDGVVAALKQTAGSISYVDFHYLLQDKLVFAKLRNRDGNFVTPTPAAFAAALTSSAWPTKATYEEMLTNLAGPSSWPITMGTFVIVPQTARSPEKAIATLKFFIWGFMHGDSLVDGADFVRLPELVQGRVFSELTKVKDRNGQPLQWSISGLIDLSP